MKQRIQFIKTLFLKETLQLLLALAIISFSYSSWFPYLSSHLSVYAIDRSYMFLLCNGILVFLGLLGASSFHQTATDSHGEFFSSDGVYSVNSVVEKEAYQVPSLGYIEYVTQQDKDKEEVGYEYTMKHAAEQNGFKIIEEDEEGIGFAVNSGLEEDQNGYWITEQVLEEEGIEEDFNDCRDDVERGHSLLTTEELNKKFDDFIRKMREEIRFGAQTQLIMV